MRARYLIGAGVAVALAAGAYWITQSPVAAQGWGMMGGYGPGYHMGWRGGPGGPGGAGPWNCPAFAQGGDERGPGPGYGPGQGQGPGYGPGQGPGPGYGPGYHMRGWGGGYGPGMMGYGRGYGPGPGYGPRAEAPQGKLNLSVDDVKARMERWLEWRDNPRLKLGDVKEKDADTITADIVTKDNSSLVDRFTVDRHTGFTRPDKS
jgi:hypothetical protein